MRCRRPRECASPLEGENRDGDDEHAHLRGDFDVRRTLHRFFECAAADLACQLGLRARRERMGRGAVAERIALDQPGMPELAHRPLQAARYLSWLGPYRVGRANTETISKKRTSVSFWRTF